MKELSAGILFFTEDNELFMGRMTQMKLESGSSRWDIPKGHVEEGETTLQAAMRECTEETGFIDYNPELLVDLGRHDYNTYKDIHLYGYLRPVRHEQFKDCVCTAMYDDPETGESFPELDRFALIKQDMWKHVMHPSLYKTLAKLIEM